MKIAILGTRGIPNNYGGFEQCAEFLSVGLVKKGHTVAVYSPSFHPFNKQFYKGVQIIKKNSPQNILGKSASNFIYDYLCLKDATKKDFDIILQLGLITAALSIIFCKHRGKTIVTNIDGLEWKRSKWNRLVQKLTRLLEKYGVKYSDYLIADNFAIKDYLLEKYNVDSRKIEYGTVPVAKPDISFLQKYRMNKGNYIVTIARLEPENNIEMICDGYINSKIKMPYYIIGNHLTDYGDFLKDKYRGNSIKFLGGIYDKNCLDSIRYYSFCYIHGHSVGGTNPALLEAMAAKALIIAHKNRFNRSVINDDAFYFNSAHDIAKILNRSNLLLNKNKFIDNNSKKIDQSYSWNIIVDKYEKYFLEILNKK